MRTMLGTTKADDETCLSDSDPVAIDTATIRVLVISIEPIVRIGVETVLAAQAVDGGRSIEVARPVDPCSTTATTSLPQPDRACDDPVDVVLYDVLGLHLTDGDDLDVAVRSHPGRVIALARALQPGLTGRALRGRLPRYRSVRPPTGSGPPSARSWTDASRTGRSATWAICVIPLSRWALVSISPRGNRRSWRWSWRVPPTRRSPGRSTSPSTRSSRSSGRPMPGSVPPPAPKRPPGESNTDSRLEL